MKNKRKHGKELYRRHSKSQTTHSWFGGLFNWTTEKSSYRRTSVQIGRGNGGYKGKKGYSSNTARRKGFRSGPKPGYTRTTKSGWGWLFG